MCSTVVELLAVVHMVPGSNPIWGHYNYTEKYTLIGIDDINEIGTNQANSWWSLERFPVWNNWRNQISPASVIVFCCMDELRSEKLFCISWICKESLVSLYFFHQEGSGACTAWMGWVWRTWAVAGGKTLLVPANQPPGPGNGLISILFYNRIF